MQQKTLPAQTTIDRIGDLATALHDPRAVRLGDHAGNLDTPRRQLDDEKHGKPSQARAGPDFDREEIRRSKYLPVRSQKVLLGRPFLSLGGRFNAVPLEDVGDRAAGDPVVQIGERALNPGVALVLGAILRCHADHQLPDLRHHTGPARPAPRAGVLLSDQVPMLGEKRVRCHQSSDLG